MILAARNIEFWFEDTKLSWKTNVQGNKITQNGMVLGCRAGPNINFGNLLHEMAHFIEINDERCLEPNWGLSVPEQYIAGRIVYEPTSYQPTCREIRTHAIQCVLARHFQVNFDAMEIGETLERFMPDNIWAPKYWGLPSWSDKSIEYADLRKEIVKCIANKIEELSKEYKIDALYQEWRRKCKIHDEHFENHTNNAKDQDPASNEYTTIYTAIKENK